MFVFDFPPSVNTYYRNWKGRMVLSTKGREFKHHVAQAVSRYEGPYPLTGRLAVYIMLHAPTRRKYDVDNRIKAILDAMESAGVFQDDEQIDVLEVRRGSVEKDGMALVSVEKIEAC